MTGGSPLSERQRAMCEEHDWDFSDLSALYVNTTLKPSPQTSHTRGLMEVSAAIMEANDVGVEFVRPVDHDVPPGVYPDMTEHGWETDEWPDVHQKVEDADIVVLGTPIWLGEESSVCRKVIDRMYGESSRLNDRGQFLYYGKVAACIVTGNEDGAKHCAMGLLYALQHMGFTVPPQADAGWVGEAGPGPSYLDEDSGGAENEFTQRNTTFLTWNLLHTARMLADRGGIPGHGNRRSAWEAGCRPDYPNPEHR